jgi:hypothetical protein
MSDRPDPPADDAAAPLRGDPPADDATLRAAKVAGALGFIFSFAALGFYGPRAGGSVLLGAAIAVANLLTMRAIIRALLQVPEPPDSREKRGHEAEEKPQDHADEGRRGGAAWGLFAVLKMALLFGGMWILLTRRLVDPIGLVVGYGVLPLGIAVSSLWSSLRPRG